MADKAAKIRSYGTYVYKNSAWKTISGQVTKKNDYIDQYIYMPDINELQDGVISKMSKITIDGSDIYVIDEKASELSALDFGDHSITFMHCNRQQGDKRLGGTKEPSLNRIVDEDLYGLGAPVSLSYTTDEYKTYIYSFANIVPQTIYSNMYALDAAAQRYKGTKKRALSAKYSATDDAFLIPFAQDTPAYTYPKGVDHSGTSGHVGYGLTREGVGSFGQGKQSETGELALTFKAKTKIDNRDIYFWEMISNPLYYEGRFRSILRVFSSIQGGKEYSVNLKSYQDNTTYYLADYAFLYDDKNKNLYILMSLYHRENSVDYIRTIIAPIDAFVVSNRTDRPFVGTLSEQLSGLLGVIINADNVPVPAPDAYGPGNPYQDTNNAGSSIGGNFDFDDVIETNDATPNTGFDTFDYQTSLFGTYVMSNKNIKDYTHTLNLLYEHSADILFGSAASAMAGRIVEGTTGLLSLPITIPSTNYANTTFAIGNTGIADENATYAELSAGNFTTANYLTKNMIEYTINMDPIKHRYDNFLDFPPYSSASIYIPYIGTQELPLGIIQSTSQYTNTLKLKVRVDVPTGDFVVILFSNGVPITHWNGNCARTIQLAVNDNSQIIRNVSNQISKAAGAIGMGAMTGGAIGAASQVVQTVAEEGIQSQTPISTTQHKIGNIQNSGVSGWMDNQQFYIIVERPVMYLPYNYGHHIGYPTDKVVRIGSCKGFCQFGEVHLECSANKAEKDEIMRVLQKGVILNVS